LVVLTADESLCHPEPKDGLDQYIVDYGNLISEEAKNKFYTEAGESFPVRVSGYGRHWNFQKPTIGFGATFLGAVIDPRATFNAVAFTIPSGDNLTATMDAHDARQTSFCRQRIPKESITTLGKDNKTLEDGDYWTYVTRSEFSGLPNPTYPIVQSNVDAFITGCMEAGEKFEVEAFAEECVVSTLGWEFTWVNDRVYPRRPDIMQPKAPEIDKLLARTVPLAFSRIHIE